MVVTLLQKTLTQALSELGIKNPVVELDHPSDEKFGDWSTNVALQYAKQLPQFSHPRELAEELVKKLQNLLEEAHEIRDITTAGPGFINFTLAHEYFRTRVVKMSEMNPLLLARKAENEQKKVIVEYSSPNIAKPFTVGHLRSTIIGDSIANIYEALGWQVFRDNHLGDWGTQFGKLIYAIVTWGERDAISRSSRPIKELVELYIRFHTEAEKEPEIENAARGWFKKLEEGDEQARELWQWCIDLSWKEFQSIYGDLGISFTENGGRGYGESFFEKRMAEVIQLLENTLTPENSVKNKGHFGQGEDGAQLIFFENDALPPLMIVKKDGATLYATRDLATDYFRLHHYEKPDLVINEVGAEQSLYFEQLFAVEEMMGWYDPGQRVHVKHGLYRFKDTKMSTRKGNVIWLEDVIAEAKKRAEALSPDKKHIAHTIAIGALKWNDLKSETNRDIVFDWDEILSMKGNSGPYIQYATVRAKSVLRKAVLEEFSPSLGDDSWRLDQEEMSLARHLDRFAETVQKSADEFAPHHLATYLFELAQRFNAFYNTHPIVNAENSDVRERRCTLTLAVSKVLEHGLSLLGIQTPEEM